MEFSRRVEMECLVACVALARSLLFLGRRRASRDARPRAVARHSYSSGE